MTIKRPKLELELNQPYRLRLLYDQPIIGDSPYNRDYFLYGVIDTITSIEYCFFPTEEVHQKFQSLQLKQNDEFIIVKKALEKGSRLVVEYEVTKLDSKAQASQEASQEASNRGFEADDNWGIKKLMAECIREANEILLKCEGIAVDKTAIALALFQHKKKGLK
ncbi:MAG: hypothetical protein ACEPOW_14055 [Bacteroidales bacterium]